MIDMASKLYIPSVIAFVNSVASSMNTEMCIRDRVLFVGIPLPGTGAWTGSLLAALLGMKFKKAFPAVVLGILLASFIMSVVSYGLLGAILH